MASGCKVAIRGQNWETPAAFLSLSLFHGFLQTRLLYRTKVRAASWTLTQECSLACGPTQGSAAAELGSAPTICRYVCVQSLPNPVVSKRSRLAFYLKTWRVFFNTDNFDWFRLQKDYMCSYACRHQPPAVGTVPRHFKSGLGSKPLNSAQLQAK